MKSVGAINCISKRSRSLCYGHMPRIVILAVMVLLLHQVSWGAGKNGGREWQVGYYAWDASYQSLETETVDGRPLPLMYVHVGEVRSCPSGDPCRDSGDLGMPRDVPSAEKYVAVVRIGDAHCPDGKCAQWLAAAFRDLKGRARVEGRTIAGLQIDYDCPTRRLADYARFLGKLRKELPKEDILSISALLD